MEGRGRSGSFWGIVGVLNKLNISGEFCEGFAMKGVADTLTASFVSAEYSSLTLALLAALSTFLR